MKTVKIKIINYDANDPFSYGNFLIPRLKKFYKVELSENPDYVFFNESTVKYFDYPNAIRIFYTGENVHPDFNLCDYAITFDYLTLGDRHFRLPLYIAAMFYSDTDIKNAGDMNFVDVPKMTQEELNKKTSFCSFVYSNYLADPKRTELYEALSQYKKVNSGGRYLNNVGRPVENKLLFEREHKFSIAFENSSREGYTTEKLPASIAARTIPIYFGNPSIGKEFNEERMINAHSFPTFDALVERIREVDENDEEYLRIINQPVLAKEYSFNAIRNDFDKFLQHIFDQPLVSAKRRSINAMHEKALEEKEKGFAKTKKRTNIIRSIIATIYSPFKKIPGLNSMKENVLRRKLSK
ncbi:glycosyltransferase [bacterium]|nr:glycosyltransferase [bacterium]|tara:strand:- start:3331 stop:4389 length:1059 start_codon:yes stop_codon:yes gene_type:complete